MGGCGYYVEWCFLMLFGVRKVLDIGWLIGLCRFYSWGIVC